MRKRLLQCLLSAIVLLTLDLHFQTDIHAQEDLSAHWNGIWTAEGTLFTLGITVENGLMKVQQIETMGFEWTNQDGKVEGNIVTVEVEYGGVTGIIQAELIDANTAVAFAAVCKPEFMVVCALAKDRQAVFRKTAAR